MQSEPFSQVREDLDGELGNVRRLVSQAKTQFEQKTGGMSSAFETMEKRLSDLAAKLENLNKKLLEIEQSVLKSPEKKGQ